MEKNKGRVENLRPVKNKAEAQARGKQGGLKSVQVKKERKLLSTMYANMLAKGFEVEGEKLSLDQVVTSVLMRADSASVSMLKEIREATEGSKVTVDGDLGTPVKFVFVDPPKKHADTE